MQQQRHPNTPTMLKQLGEVLYMMAAYIYVYTHAHTHSAAISRDKWRIVHTDIQSSAA